METRSLGDQPPAPTALDQARGRGDPVGNERLTGATALVLFVLLAAEGVTILFVGPLLSEHVFIGMLLIPPVALKLVSTGYRFFRYYGRYELYREKGPPRLLLRVLVAPVVVMATAAVFFTGVALLVLGPGGGVFLGLHKVTFIVWFAATSVHVLAYVFRVPRLVVGDLRERGPGSFARAALVVGALIAGTALALATIHLARPWERSEKSGFVPQVEDPLRSSRGPER
jgi:hypothetical protein